MSVDPTALVLADGAAVRGYGKLIHTADGDWFEPPLFEPGIGYQDQPPPTPWKHAVPIIGADFERLGRRAQWNIEVQGWATVHGHWSNGQVVVDRQFIDAVPEPPWPRHRRWVTPPCPPPPEDWPLGISNKFVESMHYDVGDLETSGAATSIVRFTVSEFQSVLVVAATDVDEVERQLRPQLGERLCVVASRWTFDETQEAQLTPRSHWESWQLSSLSRNTDEAGQLSVTVSLVRVTDEIAEWAAQLPRGLLTLNPLLVPDRPA